MSIEAHIEQHLGLSIINKQSVSTGLFSAYQVTLSDGNTVFVKYQSKPNQQLINEGRELTLLGQTIHTPAVLGSCEHCLILEWIDITHNSNIQSQMGLALAENKIGKTPQINGVGQNIDNWADFYWEYRLLHQITLAHQNTLISQTDYQQLLQVKNILPNLLNNTIKPALLHGDLWSGNVLSGVSHPYFIDTASYYGHREIDFALTFMFGGFDDDFYRSYNESYPLDSDFNKRKPLYMLYHYLNHLNIFGSGYHANTMNCVSQLLG